MVRALAICLGLAGLAFVSGCGGADLKSARAKSGAPPAAGFEMAMAKSALPARMAPAESSSAKPADRGDAAVPGPPASRPATGPMPEPSRQPNYGIQSGTLTAGSFDDHERLDDYRRYLSEVLQRDPGEKLPRMDIGRRVVILVENEQGVPVADARVVVRPIEDQQAAAQRDSGPVLVDVATAADGRAVFLSGMDGAKGRAKLSVAVYPPGGSTPTTRVIDVESPLCRVRLPSVPERHVSRLDLALVIDCTGSMSDELEYLKAEIDGIAAAVRRMFPQVEQRYALVLYRDQGDEFVTRTFDFTGSLEEFRSTLSQQHAAGGGDYPEAVDLALAEAGKLSWRKEGTARVAFLVGDAPPHEESFAKTIEAVSALRLRSVHVYPVGASGVAEQAEFIFRAAAFLTQGQYLFLTDHSGVGNSHAKPHVPDYQVERLDRLMLRMIASELAGRNCRPPRSLPSREGNRRMTERISSRRCSRPAPCGRRRPCPSAPRVAGSDGSRRLRRCNGPCSWASSPWASWPRTSSPAATAVAETHLHNPLRPPRPPW